MKQSATLFCIVAFLFILFDSAKAQDNDYIITIKGDTVKGQLNGKRFKAKGWAKAKRINLDSIQETYVAEDDILKRAVNVYRHIDTQRVFMTVLESGKINLYEHTEMEPGAGVTYMTALKSFTPSIGAANTPHWYVAKGKDTLHNLEVSIAIITLKPVKKRMEVLARLVSDNKEVYDKLISDDKFTLKQIRNIIHLYNTGKPFEEKPPKQEKEDTSNDFNPGQ